MSFKKTSLFFLFLAFNFTINAQDYRFPLDRTLSMSASFGELRSNHFHSGVDLRVGGAPGAKVFAVESGFISRIFVSPTGYGKALYIEHPNGQTSLYGHLDRFADKIAEYVEDYQYKRQRFTVNDYTDSTLFPVKKGDLIGYAGNTGSSFGAHLHFEIRESQKQTPLNVVTRGYMKPPIDNLPPTVHDIAIFTLDTINDVVRPRLLKEEKAVKKGTIYVPEKTQTYEVCNPVFFGVNANDYQPENTSKHGINQMKAYIDGELFYSFKVDEFEFADTRHINSFIAYGELVKNKKWYMKTYIEEGNKTPFYETVKNNGVIVLKDTLPHNISIELYDDLKNKSVLNFKVRRSNKVATKHQTVNSAQFITMNWSSPFEYYEDGLELLLGEESLYSDALFKSTRTPSSEGFSDLWSLGYETIPLQKPMKIRIKPQNMPSSLRQHAFIAKQVDNKISYCGGQFEPDGFIATQVYEFGNYFVSVDTIPPKVIVSAKSNNFSNQKQLTVTLSDNMSGISTYNGYIDGNWVLFEYDPKTQSMSYTLDKKQMGEKGKNRKLKVIVADNCKNTTTYLYDFIY